MLLMKYECTTYWLIAELAAWHTEQQMPQMDGRTRTAAAKKMKEGIRGFSGRNAILRNNGRRRRSRTAAS